ncbi:hypothetical protein D3C81_2181110 [compost metagenome]
MLMLKHFGMFQRQIKEDPFYRAQVTFETMVQRNQAPLQGQRIKGKRSRQAAIHIARELIRQQDQGQQVARL